MHPVPEHAPPWALRNLPLVLHPPSRVHAYELHWILDAGYGMHPVPEHTPPWALRTLPLVLHPPPPRVLHMNDTTY